MSQNPPSLPDENRPYINLVRPGKHSLIVRSPVLPASGTFGFGDAYASLMNINKLGAVITNPLTHQPWSPARGTRVVPLPAGMLVHTGLPNPGVKKAVKEYNYLWQNIPVPVIAHLVGTNSEDVTRAIRHLEGADGIEGIEIGLTDEIAWDDAHDMVKQATRNSEKPILVRVPMQSAYEMAHEMVDAGADSIVVASPPRGTARDPRSGRLVSGRIYSPTIKPMILRLVGTLRQSIQDVPIIGCGGIHSIDDARDYLDAGAIAVQVDSATWIKPALLERIARDLSGSLVTRGNNAYIDEWHPDMGDTEYRALNDTSQDDAGANR